MNYDLFFKSISWKTNIIFDLTNNDTSTNVNLGISEIQKEEFDAAQERVHRQKGVCIPHQTLRCWRRQVTKSNYIFRKNFFFEDDKISSAQWEGILSESKVTILCVGLYNEEVCVFRQDHEEYMMVIKKPRIEYRDLVKDYTINAFPVSTRNGEEVEPDDITYNTILKWICYDSFDNEWYHDAKTYVDNFQIYSKIDQMLKKNPKNRLFVVNKYEEIRAFKKESDRNNAFPCGFHCFHVKFER